MCPEWYPLFKAAQWLQVPPWTLAERSSWWRDRALEAHSAERRAEAGSDKQTLVGGAP